MNAFQNSRHIILQHCQFHNNVWCYCCQHKKTLQILLGASQLDAIHDSAARERALELIPTTDHPGFIDTFTSWSTQIPDSPRIALISGPKSDLAQQCAKRLEVHLAATYFLSDFCSNDSAQVIPTIALQLATRSSTFAEILENTIRQNPTLLSKSLRVQFREFIVAPIRDLIKRDASALKESVIIFDGFDRLMIRVRREILCAVIAAVNEGLPIHWAFFSEGDFALEREAMEPGWDTKNLFWEVDLYEPGSQRREFDDRVDPDGRSARHLDSTWITSYRFPRVVFLWWTTLLHFLKNTN